jgi:hypothetical protein
LIDRGDCEGAARLFAEGLELFRDLHDKGGIAECFECVAALAARLAVSEEIVDFVAKADALRESVGAPRPPASQARIDDALRLARERVGEDRVLAARVIADALPLDLAVESALASLARSAQVTRGG